MAKRRKYDFERLNAYCEENSVTLLEDYSNAKLHCKTIITSLCLNNDCIFYNVYPQTIFLLSYHKVTSQ